MIIGTIILPVMLIKPHFFFPEASFLATANVYLFPFAVSYY